MLRLLVCLSVLACPLPVFASNCELSLTTRPPTRTPSETRLAGMSTVLQAIGIDALDGIQRPLDILSLQETTISMTGATSIVNILNSLYGAGTYARTTVVGATSDRTTEAVIYNTHTVQLLSQSSVSARGQLAIQCASNFSRSVTAARPISTCIPITISPAQRPPTSMRGWPKLKPFALTRPRWVPMRTSSSQAISTRKTAPRRAIPRSLPAAWASNRPAERAGKLACTLVVCLAGFAGHADQRHQRADRRRAGRSF